LALAPAGEKDSSTAARYESLIRISNSIRALQKPQDLFEILVRELSEAIPFDAIAHFDAPADKVHWHPSSVCRTQDWQADSGETLLRLVYRTQEPILPGALDGETQFSELTRQMRDAGLESLCAFPLTTAQRQLGSMVIGSSRRNAYPPDAARRRNQHPIARQQSAAQQRHARRARGQRPQELPRSAGYPSIL